MEMGPCCWVAMSNGSFPASLSVFEPYLLSLGLTQLPSCEMGICRAVVSIECANRGHVMRAR